MAGKDNHRPVRHLGRVGNLFPVHIMPHTHQGSALLYRHHRPCHPHNPLPRNHLSHHRDHHAPLSLAIGSGSAGGAIAATLCPLGHHHSNRRRHRQHNHPRPGIHNNHPHHTTQHINPVAILPCGRMAAPFLCMRLASIPCPDSPLSSLILPLSCPFFRFVCENMLKNVPHPLPFQK